MAGAATVAVRPKNGNAVIDFRPESAENSAGLPGSDRRSVGLYPQGGTGNHAVCPIAGMAPGNAAPLPAAAPSGAAPATAGGAAATAGGGGESSSSRKPGAGASPRSVPLRLRQRPDRLQGCRRNARPPLEGRQHSPGGSRLSDGLKRVAGFRLPHSGRIRRISGGRFGSSCAGTPPPVADVRSAHDGALYTGRAGGQGRAATATPPEAPRQDFSGMRS